MTVRRRHVGAARVRSFVFTFAFLRVIVFGFLQHGGRTQMASLTRSTSVDTLRRGGRPCRRSGKLRRSDSFLRELRPWVPKCPTGVDSEWQLLGGLPSSKLPRS